MCARVCACVHVQHGAPSKSVHTPSQVLGGCKAFSQQCVHACDMVWLRVLPCMHAEGLRAHPIPSPTCMRHPSMATEKPSAGVTVGRERGAERAGGVNPLRSAGSPSSITSLRPLRWCSSVAAMVQPSTSWCGGTSRRPGRKPPSLHGRRLAPSALLSTRRLHSCPQQSFWPSHAQACVEGGGGWGSLKVS